MTRFAVALLALSAPLAHAATLQGHVRDSHDHAVAGATVWTQAGDKRLTTKTDAAGAYRFPELSEGTYALHAELTGSGEAASGPIVLAPKETKTVDLSLGKPEFFEKPSFVVAGVTNSASRGGHGSDTVLRSSEALAKETASLTKTTPATAESQYSLRTALARDPNNAQLHHALASLEEQLGHALDAAREYQRAAELQPSEPYLFDWGSELLTHRGAAQAAEVFTKGHQLFAKSVRMLLGLAAAEYASGSHDQAAEHFFAACDLDPSDPRPYLFLGKVKSAEITRLPGFVERMARFARLQPENALANYDYAVSLWQQRKGPEDSATPAQVEALLRKAVRLDPKLGAAYLQLGIVYASRNDFPGAISFLQKAIEVSPQLEEPHYRLAQVYGRSGDKLKANEELALFKRMSRESQARAERERDEIQQFVFELRH